MDLTNEEMPVLLRAIETHQKEIGKFNIDKSRLLTLDILSDIKTRLLNEKTKGANYGSYHVLVVDDSTSARERLKLILSKYGFRNIDEADDGHTAIVKIKSKNVPYGKMVPYDVILIDQNMPTISGLDVLKLIKNDVKYSNMPFIMITGDKNKESLVEAMNAGVQGYITKPVEDLNLMTKINKLLQV